MPDTTPTQHASSRALQRRRSFATRLARRDEPWFVGARSARSNSLMRLLAMAMVPDEKVAVKGIERAERSLHTWRAVHGESRLDDSDLLALLHECVADAIIAV